MAATEPMNLLLAAITPPVDDPSLRPPRVGLLHVPLPDVDLMSDDDGSDDTQGNGEDGRGEPEVSDSEMEDAYAPPPLPPTLRIIGVRRLSGLSRGNSAADNIEGDWDANDVQHPFGDDTSDDDGGGSEMGDDPESETDGEEEVDLSEVEDDIHLSVPTNASPRMRPRSQSLSASSSVPGKKSGVPHSLKLPRTYPCTFAGCKKIYKNPGGLKYHLLYGHPDPNNPPNPPGFFGRSGKRGRNAPDVFKPYKCCMTGCGKRYKNMNGLKYHLEHAHHDLKDDPSALPYTVRSSGRREWNLAACYDPLGAPTSVARSSSPSHRRSPYSNASEMGDMSLGLNVPGVRTRRSSKIASSGRGSAAFSPSSYNDTPAGGHFSAPATMFLSAGTPPMLARQSDRQTPTGPGNSTSPNPSLPDTSPPPVPSTSVAGALAFAASALRPSQLAKFNPGTASPITHHHSGTPLSPGHLSTIPRGPAPDFSDDDSTPAAASHLSAAFSSPMHSSAVLATSHASTVSGSLDPLQQLLAAAAIMSAPKEGVKFVKKEEDLGTRKKDGRSEDEDETLAHTDEGEEGMVFTMDE
ncbi:hypothetical protein M427DRAFT_153319 [Gonapodya prolifera JEL478]|uniref:C2H2-type domain-containing protein n=1 Tax=Gonapodya prolifera (strain JEL478) TaxID=1344416 RepID=A0A139ANR4_GONPJ|nr:hypothetical protein M427DRAFT_153319 [Gonapodya prolifera JEL478]|eukprot:KXS18125.1 hypothetical protein M427DRAFT_153319 [Gonapodya prolifera JEL478]